MKSILFILSAIISQNSFAMPNPQIIGLVNTAELGKYIGENTLEIIQTSRELARVAVPSKRLFLITTSVEVNAIGLEVDRGTKPIATLNMKDFASGIICSRDVFAKAYTDQMGEHRKLSFALSSDIRCN